MNLNLFPRSADKSTVEDSDVAAEGSGEGSGEFRPGAAALAGTALSAFRGAPWLVPDPSFPEGLQETRDRLVVAANPAARALTRAARVRARRGYQQHHLAVAVCPDAVGVVAEVTRPLANALYNIAGLTVETIAGYVVLMAMVTSRNSGKPAEELGADLAAAARGYRGTAALLQVGPAEELWPLPDSQLFHFNLRLPDTVGALGTVTGIIWDAGYPLRSFRTVVTNEGGPSGLRWCNIDMDVAVHGNEPRERSALQLQTQIEHSICALLDQDWENEHKSWMPVLKATEGGDWRSRAVRVELSPVNQPGSPCMATPALPSRESVAILINGFAQPGFVHQAAACLAKENANIVGSAMSVLEGHTALFLVVESPTVGEKLVRALKAQYRTSDEALEAGRSTEFLEFGAKKLHRPWNEQVLLIDVGQPDATIEERADCMLLWIGRDEPGAVNSLSSLLTKHKCNIVGAKTYARGQGDSEARILFSLPPPDSNDWVEVIRALREDATILLHGNEPRWSTLDILEKFE